jgi:hypothetical protein
MKMIICFVFTWHRIIFDFDRTWSRLLQKHVIRTIIYYLLRYLCLLAHSVRVQHVLRCVFVLFVFVLCTLIYCQFLWIVHFCQPLTFIYSL